MSVICDVYLNVSLPCPTFNVQCEVDVALVPCLLSMKNLVLISGMELGKAGVRVLWGEDKTSILFFQWVKS